LLQKTRTEKSPKGGETRQKRNQAAKSRRGKNRTTGFLRATGQKKSSEESQGGNTQWTDARTKIFKLIRDKTGGKAASKRYERKKNNDSGKQGRRKKVNDMCGEDKNLVGKKKGNQPGRERGDKKKKAG